LWLQKAFAINGDFGLLEGRSASLIHPIVMGGLFVYTLWTGYLGWQWRRIRTIQDEINELKKQVKPQPKKEGDPPAPPSPIETKIQQLTEVSSLMHIFPSYNFYLFLKYLSIFV